MNVDSFINNGMLIRPRRLVLSTPAWIGHIPFAASLVTVLRPGIVVELGTHAGNSYLALCQAIEESGVHAKCYAVDTWMGDVHSETYGEEVFTELRHYHDQQYGSFSTLMRMTFDEASGYFSDESIDLLHIDGLHTYEAVKHDFDTWYPKLSRRAVVLFHDINVREREFGVWRFWEEVRESHPSIDLMHSHGLGVLFAGEQIAAECADLPAAWRETTIGRTAEQLFAMLGETLPTVYRARSLSVPDALGPERKCQPEDSSGMAHALRASMRAEDRVVAYHRKHGEAYSEDTAELRLWEARTNCMYLEFHVDLPQGGLIRVDPSEHGGWFNIIDLQVNGVAVNLIQDLHHCNGEIIETGSAGCFSFLERGNDPYVEFEIAAPALGETTSRHSVSLSVAKRGMLEALQATQAGVNALLANGPPATHAIAALVESSAECSREATDEALTALAAELRATAELALHQQAAGNRSLEILFEHSHQMTHLKVAEFEGRQQEALEKAVKQLSASADAASHALSDLVERYSALDGTVSRISDKLLDDRARTTTALGNLSGAHESLGEKFSEAVKQLSARADAASQALSDLLARYSALDGTVSSISDKLLDDRAKTITALDNLSGAHERLGEKFSEAANNLVASIRLQGSQSQGRQAVVEGLIADLSKTLSSTNERMDAMQARVDHAQSRRWAARASRLLGTSRDE